MTTEPDAIRFTSVGDTAFNVEFGSAIDPVINAKVRSLAAVIERERAAGRFEGLVEVVPTFRSLLVQYDPLRTCRAGMEDEVRAALRKAGDQPFATGSAWRIPVCYDADLGPDLDEVANACGLTRDEVVALHTGATYFVYMLGFMPGFAYMGGIVDKLRLPRRASPRLKVPAGSVAMAEELTTVYPWDSPGGWHLLGRTPMALFDARRNPPALLRPGDHVTFQAISRATFDAAARANGRLSGEG